MKHHQVALLCLLSIVGVWSGCSEGEGGEDGQAGGAGLGGIMGGEGDNSTGLPGGDGGLGGIIDDGFDNTIGDDFVACETLTTELNRVATRVMLLEDKSQSMREDNKWTLAMGAIQEMVTAYDSEISFGLDLFARPGGRSGGGNGSSCAVGESVVHDVALNNGTVITNELSQWEPGDATPLLLAMQNYTDSAYAPAFSAGGGSYLVIISDGQDSCGPEGVYDQQGGATAQELAAVTSTLRNDEGIKTIVIGFGEGADPDQLNAIAAAGGTPFTQYLSADNGDELKSALSQIAETVVVSCDFKLGTFQSDNVDYNRVVVTFDGKAIPRDDNCAKNRGWTFSDSSHTAIEFCQAACATLEDGDVSGVKVQLACSDEDVPILE
ncbi:MAG: VWA domain-containing protein [Deltaproteobacteria bacterium]|nr:VWA domain-containing protein [Deltaproteobacteria bacterium]